MSPLTAESLTELTLDALARTAFVIAEPFEDGCGDDLPEATCFARIEYSGPNQGWVGLAASEGFVRELAASLLGVEGDEIDMNIEGADAFRELANILGGSVILALGGNERNLSLGLPERLDSNPFGAPVNGGRTCLLDAEGERLEIHWIPNEARAAA